MVVNEEDRWFLNNITNSVLAQAQRVNSIFERTQEMNNQEMNTMMSNDQSNEERTIEDLPPSYRSILRSNHHNTTSNPHNTTFEKQLIREIKEIKLRILDIFKILNRCEDNFLVALSFCVTISITFVFFYLIYVYSYAPVLWGLETNSSLTTTDSEKTFLTTWKKTFLTINKCIFKFVQQNLI